VRLIIILLSAALLTIIYLNRTYANFYHNIGSHNFANPAYSQKNVISPKTFAKKINYVALGDSLTAGIGAGSKEKTLPYLFSIKIADSESAEVTLHNMGRPSITSRQLIELTLAQAISINPDLVTLFIGINDLHNKISPSQFEKNLDIILERLKKETKAKIILINLPYLGDKSSALPPYNLLLDVRTKQFNNTLKKAAEHHSVILVDLYASTNSQFKSDSALYASDKFHPSDKGYVVLSEIIYANYSRKP
jgi:lysophospholipase L1-like esterase